jgi:hypothetical protein
MVQSPWCLSLDKSSDDPEPTILTAFILALEGTAEASVDEFTRITKESWVSQSAVVHQLLIHGLIVAVRVRPSLGLEYLSEDRRRFSLGSSENHNQSDSIQLIKELAPRLSSEELATLVNLILSFTQFRDEVVPIEDQNKWDRETRLRLLDAIPANLLGSGLLEFIDREKTALPDWNEQISRSKSGWIKKIPPITKESMLAAPNDDILAAVDAAPSERHDRSTWVEVDGGWEEPGGPREVAHEIAEMSKEHPERALELISLLVRNGKEDLAAAALRPISEIKIDDASILAFVREIAALNPKSEELCSALGYQLYRICRPNIGLPQDVCDALNHWLSNPWVSSVRAFREVQPKQNKEKEPPESILWSHTRGFIDRDNSFWCLLAITEGYLMRSPPETRRWLDVIEASLRRDISERTWIAYCYQLKWISLEGCDVPRGTRLIANMFERFPTLSVQTEGIRLTAR